MKIPKSYELQLATCDDRDGMQYDAIRLSDDGHAFEATDGVIAARVPIASGRAPGVRLEPGEVLPSDVALRPEGWAEATRGMQGEGTLRLAGDRQEARSGERKPAMLFEPPPPGLETPPIGALLATACDAAAGRRVELLLDAEALARLQRALGANRGVVLSFRLRAEDSAVSRPVEGPIEVTDVLGGHAVGCIMPIVSEGEA